MGRHFLVCLLLGLGCGNGSVGWDPCASQQVLCAAQSLQGTGPVRPIPTAVGTVTVDDAQALAPTWTRPLPVVTPDDETPYYQYEALLTDSARSLYLAWVDLEGKLRLSRLDSEGSLADSSAVVEPPEAYRASGDMPVIYKYYFTALQTDGQPTIKVMWAFSCQKTIPSTCDPGSEKVLFSSELGQAPARFMLDDGGDVFRDEDGDFYTSTSARGVGQPWVVEKLARDTRRVEWQQHDLLHDDEEYPVVNGVALGHGRTAYMLSNSTFSKHTFVVLDGEGRPTVFGIETYEPAERHIALLGSLGKPVIAISYGSTLVVERAGPPERPIEDMVVTSQGYASPALLQVAADPAGDVYLVTRSGGVEGVKPTLCRVKHDTGSCVTLPPYIEPSEKKEFLIDDIVAQSDGVVYVRVGKRLVRFDFPN